MSKFIFEFLAAWSHLVGYVSIAIVAFAHRDAHCAPYCIITLGAGIHMLLLLITRTATSEHEPKSK